MGAEAFEVTDNRALPLPSSWPFPDMLIKRRPDSYILALRAPSTPVLNNHLLRKGLLRNALHPLTRDSSSTHRRKLHSATKKNASSQAAPKKTKRFDLVCNNKKSKLSKLNSDNVNMTPISKEKISTTNKDILSIDKDNNSETEDSKSALDALDVYKNNFKDDVIICNLVFKDENNIIYSDDNFDSNFNDVSIVSLADDKDSEIVNMNCLFNMNNLDYVNLNVTKAVTNVIYCFRRY